MADFEAGTAYVQVVPSLKGFQTKVSRDLKSIFANGAEVKVVPQVDTRKAETEIGAFATRIRRQIQAAIDSLPDVKLGIDANTDAATRRILQIKRELESIQTQRIGIDIDAAEAQRRIRDLTTELTRLSAKSVDVQVKADTAKAAADLRALDRDASRLNGRTVNLRVDVKGLTETIVGAASLSRAMGTLALPTGLIGATPYVLSFAASLAQAAGAAALLPAGLVAGGVAAGTFALGLSGIGATFKALAKEDDKATTTAVSGAKARQGALNSVRSAQDSLADAERAADRASEQGAQRVADARRAVADAVANATRQIKDAQDDLTRSEGRARQSREDLTRAYKDAREELQQLQFSVEGAGLAEEAAADRLGEARKRLDEARAQGAGADEIKDLDREVRQADLDLRIATDRYSDLKAEGAEWARTGISGSQGVVAAQRQVADADQSVAGARAALTQAQLDGDRSVADARRDLGRTITAVGQQQADAARAVERATLALGAAQSAAATAGVAGATASSVAMAKLSPQAKALVGEVRALGPAWTAMRLDVQDRLLAGIGVRIGQLGRTYIPILGGALGTVADGYNRAATDALGFMSTASTVGDVRFGLDNVAAGTSLAAQAMTPLTAAFTDLVTVGSTFLPGLGAGVAGLAVQFAAFISHARDTGQLAGWIQSGIDTIRLFGELFWNVGSIIGSVLGAAAGSGQSFLSMLTGFTGAVASALKTPEGAAALQGFFVGIRTVVGGVIDHLIQLWPAISAAGGAFLALLAGAKPVTDLLFGLVSTILPPLLDAIGWLAPVLGPVIAILGAGAAAMWAWTLATNIASIAVTAYETAVAVATALIHPIATATKVWAGVQWLLNTALSANPIGIVVVVLAALVAAIVLAWQHSETFRSIVIGAWEGIKTAVFAVWTGFLQPVFSAIVTAVQWLGSAVMWLWSNVFLPVFSFIGQAAMVLLAIIATVVIAPLIIAFNLLAPVVMWLWHNVFEPAFQGIATAVLWAWDNVLKPVWDGLVWVLRNVIAPTVMWLWTAVIAPVWNGIAATIATVWWSIIKPIWDGLVWTIRNIIGPAALWLWNTIIAPAWNGIGTIISGVWNGVIKPAWDAIVGGLNWVGDNFNRVVDWIGGIWNRLRGLLARPINFLIGTVWNNGIRKAWNLVAGILPGIDPIGELPLIAENAQGGMYERHTAQIAPAGAMRLWAEPETGGEAYIPLAASKRSRSTGILGQVADEFGYALAPRDLATFADGGLWRRMFGVVKGQFPGATLNSAYRPGDPGYHGKGKATDLGGPMMAINRWLANAFANSTELIHTPGINLWHGQPHVYNAATRAEHFNHVHWALENEAMLRGAPGNYTGGNGDGGSWIGDKIRQWVGEIIDPLIARLPTPPPAFAGIPRAATTKVRDTALDWFLGQSDTGGTPVAGSGPVRQQVQGVATHFGWGTGPQWAALDWLINKESSWNPLAKNPRSTAFGLFQFLDCVPLDTEILTRDGWKRYDEVQPGDETIGYNPESGRSEWTEILGVVVKPAQRVVHIGSSRWTARVTPGHRWWTMRKASVPVRDYFAVCPECGATRTKRGPFTNEKSLRVHRAKVHGVAPREPMGYEYRGEFCRTDSLTTAHDLVLAAAADTGAALPISEDEARILGWIAGDGHIHGDPDGTLAVSIYQSKPDRVAELRQLLASVPHSESSRQRSAHHLRAYTFYLHAGYARELLKRSGWIEDGPEAFILACSPSQRAAWLEAMIAAEGSFACNEQAMRIPQNDGPVAEAIVLAAYLAGYRPSRRHRAKQPGFSMITLSRPGQHAGMLRALGESEEPVWCVRTTLGTWTMRQDEQVSLTGNSTWGTVGGHKTTNPGLQAEFGNRYIQRKYRDPAGAQSFHKAHNWYDEGGWLPPGYSTIYNGTGRDEALVVFNQQQWAVLRSLADRDGGDGGTVNNVQVYAERANAESVAAAVDRHLAFTSR